MTLKYDIGALKFIFPRHFIDMKFTLVHRSKILTSLYKDWIHKSDNVLDIGCGNGIVANELKNYFNCKMTCTDIMNYLKVSFPFKIMKNENEIPFKDNTFDVSLLNDVLHHTNNQKQMIKEASRVSKNVLIFEVSPSLKVKVADYLINKLHNPRMKTPFNFRNLYGWEQLFEEVNLNVKCFRIRKASINYPFTTYAFNVYK